MSLESRIQALEDHCNHSLANAKLIAEGGISLPELHADVLARPYLGEDYEFEGDDPLTVDQLANEDLCRENADLRDDLDAAIILIGELMLERARG